MKKITRQVMLVCMGLNIGIIIHALAIPSNELLLVGGLSIASCAVGYMLNQEQENDV